MVRLSAAIMVLVGLNAAAARATTYSTAVSIGISPSGSAFAGKVTSPNAACRDSRSVVLQRKSPGQTIFAKVGIATTSAAGGWSVRTAPVVGAQYRAIVGAKKLSATNACAPATSQTVVARKTTASIAAGTSNFHGSVGSSSSACVSGRAVSLQRRSVYGSAFQTIGGAISNSAGSWAVSTAPISGDSYRASVAAKQVGTNACMTALSGVQVQSVVYVSATGSDSDPGTAAHPKRTLNAAIAAASAASPHEAVYAATGTYDDGVVDLASGVAVYGGFDNTWRPAASGHTTVAGRPEAVLADTVTGADLERVTLEGALGSGDLSAFGVVATNSTITLRNVSATAAAGASGTDGAAPPAAPLAAPNGTPGDPGVENSAFPCSSGSQPLGGLGAAAPGARHGGQGGSAGLGGQAGLTGVSGGGGAAGGPGTPAVQGDWNTPMTYWGTDGASGSTGSNGSAGTAAYSSSGYAPTDGADGGSGGGGQGGGGGGGGGGGINGCHSYGGGGGVAAQEAWAEAEEMAAARGAAPSASTCGTPRRQSKARPSPPARAATAEAVRPARRAGPAGPAATARRPAPATSMAAATSRTTGQMGVAVVPAGTAAMAGPVAGARGDHPSASCSAAAAPHRASARPRSRSGREGQADRHRATRAPPARRRRRSLHSGR